jgi:hypothetical protein
LRIAAHGVQRKEARRASGRRGRQFLGLTTPRRAVLGFVRFVDEDAIVEFGRLQRFEIERRPYRSNGSI